MIRLYDIGAQPRAPLHQHGAPFGKSLKEQMRQPIEFRTALGSDAGVPMACRPRTMPEWCTATSTGHTSSSAEDGVLKVMDFGSKHTRLQA